MGNTSVFYVGQMNPFVLKTRTRILLDNTWHAARGAKPREVDRRRVVQATVSSSVDVRGASSHMWHEPKTCLT